MKIEIKYHVDNDKFTDSEFENEPQRTFIIDMNMLSNILRSFGNLKINETLHEVEVNVKI